MVEPKLLTRTNIGGGSVWMTFTPLLGMSDESKVSPWNFLAAA